jgi:hypothetical protein
MYLSQDIKNMKKVFVIISGIFLFLFCHEKSFAQQAANNNPTPGNAIAVPVNPIVSDTAQVRLNTAGKINDSSSTPVPVEQNNNNKEEPVIINQPRKQGKPD